MCRLQIWSHPSRRCHRSKGCKKIISSRGCLVASTRTIHRSRCHRWWRVVDMQRRRLQPILRELDTLQIWHLSHHSHLSRPLCLSWADSHRHLHLRRREASLYMRSRVEKSQTKISEIGMKKQKRWRKGSGVSGFEHSPSASADWFIRAGIYLHFT